jgi:hypothetical protein
MQEDDVVQTLLLSSRGPSFLQVSLFVSSFVGCVHSMTTLFVVYLTMEILILLIRTFLTLRKIMLSYFLIGILNLLNKLSYKTNNCKLRLCLNLCFVSDKTILFFF